LQLLTHARLHAASSSSSSSSSSFSSFSSSSSSSATAAAAAVSTGKRATAAVAAAAPLVQLYRTPEELQVLIDIAGVQMRLCKHVLPAGHARPVAEALLPMEELTQVAYGNECYEEYMALLVILLRHEPANALYQDHLNMCWLGVIARESTRLLASEFVEALTGVFQSQLREFVDLPSFPGMEVVQRLEEAYSTYKDRVLCPHKADDVKSDLVVSHICMQGLGMTPNALVEIYTKVAKTRDLHDRAHVFVFNPLASLSVLTFLEHHRHAISPSLAKVLLNQHAFPEQHRAKVHELKQVFK
jgi:hypothetical protein